MNEARTRLWQEDIRGALKNYRDVEEFFKISLASILHLETEYPVFIPLTLAKVIKLRGPESVLWKQFIPHYFEGDTGPKFGLKDPIGDETYTQKGQLIHRYRNRLLFTPTSTCAVNCRFCFRKNKLNTPNTSNSGFFNPHFEETLKYLKSHPEINEVIFSGGDPLTLSDAKIDFFLREFSQIASIKYIRFHTRTPIIIPSRINKTFLNILNKYRGNFKKIFLVLHVNHADEINAGVPGVKGMLYRLHSEQYEVLAQTVLLKGINDRPSILIKLFEALIDQNVRPYYLHHPDPVKGGEHFHLSLEEGRRIYGMLRRELSGWAIPEYVIDIPGGEGKVQAFNPEGAVFNGKLISKDGFLVEYAPRI